MIMNNTVLQPDVLFKFLFIHYRYKINDIDY
jgi:hypothetical protein